MRLAVQAVWAFLADPTKFSQVRSPSESVRRRVRIASVVGSVLTGMSAILLTISEARDQAEKVLTSLEGQLLQQASQLIARTDVEEWRDNTMHSTAMVQTAAGDAAEVQTTRETVI